MVHEVTFPTHIYLANWSQPSPGAGVHCAKWAAHPRASQVGFCAFFCTIFASSHHSTLLSRLFHVQLCHDDSSVFISKDHHLRDLWLCSSKLFGSWGSWTYPLVWLWIQLRFKVYNPCFVNSDNSIQECSNFKVKSLFQECCNFQVFLFLFSSQAVRDPSGTNFSFLQIVCQNTEYWCWWNTGSLRYFLACRLTILCKKFPHKFHTSFNCWCFQPSWFLVIVYGDTFHKNQ